MSKAFKFHKNIFIILFFLKASRFRELFLRNKNLNIKKKIITSRYLNSLKLRKKKSFSRQNSRLRLRGYYILFAKYIFAAVLSKHIFNLSSNNFREVYLRIIFAKFIFEQFSRSLPSKNFREVYF